jgi:SAM-dependent methyltransferase
MGLGRRSADSARFWDAAALENAAWYVATAYTEESSAFFAQGARETDELLRFCAVDVVPGDVLLEIGCGVGRMTGRLAELSHRVIAVDVSTEMLAHARANLRQHDNVDLVAVPGDGTLPLAAASVDVVFSYIVLQHVPSAEAQMRYLRESLRVLRTGGRLAIQIRAPGAVSAIHEWVGHTAHFAQGRRTLDRAWRGARLRQPQVLALARPNIEVAVRRSGHRHSWVVARRT